MSDRYLGFTVTLAVPSKDEDAENTINAIRQIKGVIEVVPVVADPAAYMAGAQAAASQGP